MNLLNSSSPLVLVILLIASNFMAGHLQDIARGDDVTVPDSELDPLDIQEYDLEKENRQPVITTELPPLDETTIPEETTFRPRKITTEKKTATTVETTTREDTTSTVESTTQEDTTTTVETTTREDTTSTVESTTQEDTTTTVETTTQEDTTTTVETTTQEVITTTTVETTTQEVITTTVKKTTEKKTTTTEEEKTTTIEATTEEKTSSQTTKSTVTSTIKSTTTSTTIESTTEETTSPASEDTTTIQAKVATTRMRKKPIKELDANAIEYVVNSNKYQDLKIEKTVDQKQTLTYAIRASDANYQIQLNVFTESHIDFRACGITYQTDSQSAQCLQSYIQIINSDFVLKINTDLLPNTIKLRVRLVISGCDQAPNRIRDVELAYGIGLPNIYHNSDQECIYRVLNSNLRRSMVKVSLFDFPLKQDKVCHAHVQISSGDNADEIDRKVQVKFDSLESFEPFQSGVMVAAKYTFIKVVNCYENDPVEIAVDAIRRAVGSIKLSEKKTYYQFDSDIIASPTQDPYVVAEIQNENFRNMLAYRLDYVIDQRKLANCDKADQHHNTSLVTIYGVNEQDRMVVRQFFPCNYEAPLASEELLGFKYLFVQFYRETKNPNVDMSADKIIMYFNLKTVQTKYITLTSKSGRVTSDDYDSIYLRNVQLDFEIKAPLGHRILLNLTRFNNGKANIDEQICDDYIVVRLNKTTNRESPSFYEMSSNPKFCNSLDSRQPFVLMSSYTNTLLVTIFFKQLDSNQAELDFPHFEFTYRTEPFCGNQFTNRSVPLISFSSLQSLGDQRECHNMIYVGRQKRIVMYKIDWLSYYNNDLIENDEIDVNYMNGRVVCAQTDSLQISNDDVKYENLLLNNDNMNNIYNIYCMNNPFRAFVSERNKVFLSYKTYAANTVNKSDLAQMLVKPLVFDIGYFSYKHLYDDYDREVDLDFGSIIPANVGSKTRLNNLEVKISLTNRTNYIVPVIRDCYLKLDQGEILLKTSSRSIRLNLDCANQTFASMFSMEHELKLEFRNVLLSELRDKRIRLRIEYTLKPKVFTTHSGSFDSISSDLNVTQNNHLSMSKDRIEYEWLIDVAANHLIRLNVDEIKNEMNIAELSILDARTNVKLYDQNEILDNYRNGRSRAYVFSTNRVKVVFKHERDQRKRAVEYPYLKCSYTSEAKLIMSNSTGIIKHVPGYSKSRIEWMILAPVEHVIVVRVLDYQAPRESNGQIKLSLLNTGTYHLNLNDKPDEATYDRPTDIAVSKSNMISVEYLPGGVNDQFKLEYSIVRNVYVKPCGLIRQRYNELTRPVVYVPKWTDQSWIVRAPYTKQIVIYTKYLDLLDETVCSKTSVNFYESNGTRLFSECGNYELDKFDLRSSMSLVSDSNELTVNFVTQNTNEVVYSRPQPGRDGNLHVYKGFLFYYAFLETPGDCYFQLRRSQMCGYEPVGQSKWVIVGDASSRVSKDEYDVEFDKHICANCYVSSHIPLQGEHKQLASTLMSPVIERSKNMLEFDYRLSGRAILSVKFVYNGASQESVLLRVYNETTGNKWTRAKIRIGSRLLHDYKVMFVLEKSKWAEQGGSEMPSVSLDNIQLFERDFECVMNMDETCLAARELAGHHLASGEFCQPYRTPCDSNNCQNGAVCVNKHQPNRFNATVKNQLVDVSEWDDEYTCECLPGFTGLHCETRLDPCEPSTSRCFSNGTLECQAKLESNTYECKCKDNYFGKFCENRIKPCKLVENACNQRSQQGVCHDLDIDKFFCVCSPMYTGNNCDVVVNQRCLNSECNLFDANATCIELQDRFVCRCSPGFEGPMCTNIDDCVNSPCRNNGTCIDGINSFECKCTDNYEGKYCENSRVCSQCNPQGTLSCDPDQAKCVCKETHGGLLCDVELDPCLDMPCVNGECVSNKVNRFECVCNNGWKGHLCDRKEDICDQGLCQNGATCMLERDISSDDINYFCSCPAGFEGRNCEHMINKCSSLEPCKNGATCISSVNNYTCICPPNYEGRNCELQIDYCQLKGQCAYGSTCHSVVNGFICKCPPGRFGRLCDEELDKCLENECQNGRCLPNELDTGYTCQCLPGFGGRLCDLNVDDCESSPCESGATCVDLVDSYRCLCPPGRTGRNCQDSVDYCSDMSTRCHPKHTRQCIPIPGGVKCDCLSGFTGVKCESAIDLCDFVKPCRTGVCVMNETGGDYECRDCAEGYGGKNCSQMIDYCETMKPCHNEARCLTKLNDYHCVCSEMFRGKNCDIAVEPVCVDNKCVNNATCVADKDGQGYKCECQGDYEGWYCEKKRNKCHGVDCKYGYCVDGRCECDPKIPMCNSECKLKNVVCENGGKCVDVIKGAKVEAYCLCPPGLTGTFCEQSIYCNSPRVRPCGANHQCVTVNQSYECHCDSPLIGHGCSKKLDDFVPAYESFIKQEKRSALKQQCRFGHSKESKILIGVVGIGSVILLIIGLMFGHCSINAYKKRCEAASSLNSKSNYSVMSSATGGASTGANSSKAGSNLNLYRTPVRSMNAQEITLNKSSAFSIPRPAVRL